MKKTKRTAAVLLAAGMVFSLAGEGLSAYGKESGRFVCQQPHGAVSVNLEQKFQDGLEQISSAVTEMSGLAQAGKTDVSAKETYKQKKKKLDYAGDEIRADLRHVDLIVRPSKDDGFYLKYDVSSKKGKNPLLVSTKDEALYLKEKDAEETSWYRGISIEGTKIITGKDGYRNVVTLYVPSDREINFTASMEEGDLELEEFQIRSADIAVEEGDIELSDMMIQGGTITAGEGDIEAENLEITSPIYLDDARCASRNEENTELFCDVRIQSEDGDISLELGASCRDTLSISAGTEMDLEVSKKELGGKLTRKHGRTFYRRTVAGLGNQLTVTSEDGDITIE